MRTHDRWRERVSRQQPSHRDVRRVDGPVSRPSRRDRRVSGRDSGGAVQPAGPGVPAKTGTAHRNNFDALRIAAALAVIVGHGFELTGHASAVPRVLGFPLHTLGVQVFFIISGYLIATSWIRSPRLTHYLRNRALRIFPALAAVVLASVFILGPIISSLSVSEYFRSDRTWNYLLNIFLRPVYDLPGVFSENAFSHSVNGSLWTLPIEFACYLFVPILLFVKRPALAVLVFALASVGVSRFVDEPLIAYGTSWQRAFGLWVAFAAGMLMAVLSRKIQRRADVALVLLVVQVLVAASFDPPTARAVAWITLPYVVITFGMMSTPGLRSVSRFGDISYGLYIFAFPVQQLIVMRYPGIPLAANVMIVTVVTALLAFASWHAIEKHALRLKARPSRGRPEAARDANAVRGPATGEGPAALET
ncbi:acyltransferase family protein [Agromyces intestinalis]|uniref:acyltransferase family protein n=1 Tax=Agromyces intestinalis TaxID=2592652 RepID=UPI00143E0199|nr:acyltransferase [Agromyces intestinalis]